MKAIKTVNQVIVNSVTQKQAFVGFLPTKKLCADGSYKGSVIAYELVEQFSADGTTSLGFSLGNQILVDEQDLTMSITQVEMQGIYDSLVTAGLIDPSTQTFLEQEDILLYQGSIQQIISFKLFGLTLSSELEIITIFEQTN